jgi:mRNA-degrading endonuclease YafQ of YafQ-DinJ toxin-antitoxin module
MEVEFTKQFDRTLIKFLRKHPDCALLIENRIRTLKNTPNHTSLRLHKLSNRENEYAMSIDHSIRIILFREDNTCYLLEIGSHDEVY